MNHEKVNIPENVTWVVEANGILIIDTINSLKVFITYPEAAVWDILSRHGINQMAVSMLSAVCQIKEADTRELIENICNRWKQLGLISDS